MSVNEQSYSAEGDRYYRIATELKELEQYNDALKYYMKAQRCYNISGEDHKIEGIYIIQPIVDEEDQT